MIKYFISYAWSLKDKNGWGNCTANRENKIESSDDIVEIAELIKQNESYVKGADISILFWREF